MVATNTPQIERIYTEAEMALAENAQQLETALQEFAAGQSTIDRLAPVIALTQSLLGESYELASKDGAYGFAITGQYASLAAIEVRDTLGKEGLETIERDGVTDYFISLDDLASFSKIASDLPHLANAANPDAEIGDVQKLEQSWDTYRSSANDLQSLGQQRQEAQSLATSLSDEIVAAEAALKTLEEGQEELPTTQQVDEAKSAIAARKTTIETLESQLAQYEKDVAQRKKQQAQELDNEQLTDAEKAALKVKHKSDNEVDTQTLVSYRRDITEHKAGLKEVQQLHDSLAAKLEKLEETPESLQTKITELKEKLSAQGRGLRDIEEAIEGKKPLAQESDAQIDAFFATPLEGKLAKAYGTYMSYTLADKEPIAGPDLDAYLLGQKIEKSRPAGVMSQPLMEGEPLRLTGYKFTDLRDIEKDPISAALQEAALAAKETEGKSKAELREGRITAKQLEQIHEHYAGLHPELRARNVTSAVHTAPVAMPPQMKEFLGVNKKSAFTAQEAIERTIGIGGKYAMPVVGLGATAATGVALYSMPSMLALSSVAAIGGTAAIPFVTVAFGVGAAAAIAGTVYAGNKVGNKMLSDAKETRAKYTALRETEYKSDIMEAGNNLLNEQTKGLAASSFADVAESLSLEPVEVTRERLLPARPITQQSPNGPATGPSAPETPPGSAPNGMHMLETQQPFGLIEMRETHEHGIHNAPNALVKHEQHGPLQAPAAVRVQSSLHHLDSLITAEVEVLVGTSSKQEDYRATMQQTLSELKDALGVEVTHIATADMNRGGSPTAAFILSGDNDRIRQIKDLAGVTGERNIMLQEMKQLASKLAHNPELLASAQTEHDADSTPAKPSATGEVTAQNAVAANDRAFNFGDIDPSEYRGSVGR